MVRNSEKNRIQNSITVSNIGIASILSDHFGKTATEIISYLLTHTSESFDEKACRKLIKKGAKAKSDDIIAAIKGYTIEADQRLKIELARGHLDYLDEMITKSEIELYVRIKPYWHLVEFITSMPGMTEISAILTLAEIGIDISVFDDAKHLTSWTGLSPTNNEIAGKKKSVRISKAGQYIKPLLVQCALTAELKARKNLILQSNINISKNVVTIKKLLLQ